MFKDYKGNDFYFTNSLISKPDSLRPEKIWSSIDCKVNVGVWGIRISKNIIKFMNFWIENLLNPPWEEWRNY